MKVIVLRNVMVDGKLLETNTEADIEKKLVDGLEKLGIVKVLEEEKKPVKKILDKE